MKTYSLLVVAGLAAVLVSGCGNAPQRAADFAAEQSTASARSHSAAEMQAAAKLSLLSSSRLEEAPYKRAVNCAAAVRALTSIVEANGALGAQEIGALRQASAFFQQQALRLAADQEASPAQTEAAITAAADAGIEGASGKTASDAMACIRNVAEGQN